MTTNTKRITWTGPSGDRLTLGILGYQFSEIAEGYDANWITVGVEARCEDREWARESSCLLSWEIEWMWRWLHHIRDGAARDCDFAVDEFDLRLIYIAFSEGTHRLVACLSYGLGRSGQGGDVSVLHLALSPGEYEEALEYLLQAHRTFPPRGKQGRRSERLPGPKVWRDGDEVLPGFCPRPRSSR